MCRHHGRYFTDETPRTQAHVGPDAGHRPGEWAPLFWGCPRIAGVPCHRKVPWRKKKAFVISPGGSVERDKFEEIKRLTLIGLFSDDELMDMLVLKGGNALDIVYRIAPRASLDIDLSIENDFDLMQIDRLRARIEKALKRTFNEGGYEIFDVTLEEKPEVIHPKTPGFWGGYQLQFKLITAEQFKAGNGNLGALRRNAQVVGPRNRRTFHVDISRCEYCRGKTPVDIDGYTVYVYTPQMIAFEKLRAICQQTEEYCSSIGKSHRQARARDFFDIHTVIEHFRFDVVAPTNLELLSAIFSAKQVPLYLLRIMRESREFHRPDFTGLVETLKPGVRVRDFDFYFDYVAGQCDRLVQALGVI
jgi:hypothetical protein